MLEGNYAGISDESHAAMLGRVEASIMGESALIDRETGRVYWEGGSGSTTLFESFGPKMDQYGLDHAQTALFTGLITLAFLGVLAGWMRQLLDQWALNTNTQSAPMNLMFRIVTWTILRLPRIENRWLVIASIALYLIESYCCGTRYYLANALSSQEELEEYINQLRIENPVVTWNVSSFHFEKRKIFALSDFLRSLKRKLSWQADAVDMVLAHKNRKSMFPFTKKVVTHRATATYQYNGCLDSTMAGIWRRARIMSTNNAPFAKIALTVLLVLADKKSREDYFRQQSDFVSEHGRGDEFTEFATQIQVKGCKPCILAVRPVDGVMSTRLFRLQSFWFCTFLGLTLPYRIWFKRRCDFLRLTIVKETSSYTKPGSSSRGWFSKTQPAKSHFQSFMQRQSLYTSGVALKEIDSVETTARPEDNEED
ncbi:unnamed protein product [Cylindrotheca closterium]|uniref:Uncharacterized protein n=1 Tax=Cylindrotheca closterium TaxID=2856 RepID=A0AAD2FZT9_9STRA|nr:unnamed protein product [Cylindrotheca closterium]